MLYLICSDIHGSRVAANLVATLDFKYNFKKNYYLGDVNYSGATQYLLSIIIQRCCASLKPFGKKLLLLRLLWFTSDEMV